MLLIGVNRSPYTRRVAITLQAYGLVYEQRPLSGFDNRSEVRIHNPLGRIPTHVLDTGEALADSTAIIDHLDEIYGRDRALTPPSGADRRAVLQVAAIMMGACDKLLAAAYERNHRPPEKVHQPWRDDCIHQASEALAAIDRMADVRPYLLLGRLTQADVTAFVAERLARGLGIDTATRRASRPQPGNLQTKRRFSRPNPDLRSTGRKVEAIGQQRDLAPRRIGAQKPCRRLVVVGTADESCGLVDVDRTLHVGAGVQSERRDAVGPCAFDEVTQQRAAVTAAAGRGRYNKRAHTGPVIRKTHVEMLRARVIHSRANELACGLHHQEMAAAPLAFDIA
jgi:glutathione S-transferase